MKFLYKNGGTMLKLINRLTGGDSEVLFELSANHSMTKDEIIIFSGLLKNNAQESTDDGDFVDEFGNEYWYEDLEVINDEIILE